MLLLFSESNCGFAEWLAGQNFCNSDETDTGQQLGEKGFPRNSDNPAEKPLQLSFRGAENSLQLSEH